MVEEINKDGGRFHGVTILEGAEKIEIKPEIIIAADGETSIFPVLPKRCSSEDRFFIEPPYLTME